jgi:hypothetical protein
MLNKDINTLAWCVLLECGQVLKGIEKGSFRNVKNREDIVDLWVHTDVGTVYAFQNGTDPVKFDFFVHVTVPDMNKPDDVQKHFKLVTIYPDKTFIKHVFPYNNTLDFVEEK